jgi:hypothetical protein
LDCSYLWLDSWIYPLSPAPGRRLGDWKVGIDGGPLAELQNPGLNRAMKIVNVPPLDFRYPVLAYGSNAAPSQLLDKFASIDPSERVIPVTRGLVRGLGLSHSPHISNPGYVPYVVVGSEREVAMPVFVLWLDETQLRVINQTEPNYRLVNAPADRYPLTLESGEPIAGYSLYRGNWGALRFAQSNTPAAAGSQHDVFAALNNLEWFRNLTGPGDVAAQQRRLREDRVLRDQVRTELTVRGLAISDGWPAVG